MRSDDDEHEEENKTLATPNPVADAVEILAKTQGTQVPLQIPDPTQLPGFYTKDDAEWLPLEGETELWHQRFVRYYLSQGLNRTVAGAYRVFCRAEGRELKYSTHGCPTNWTDMARLHEWPERARAYDRHVSAIVNDQITRASLLLKLIAPEAVIALRMGLQSPRNSVNAAREILDRAGLPAVTKTILEDGSSISSDEMAAATKDLQDWTPDSDNESSG